MNPRRLLVLAALAVCVAALLLYLRDRPGGSGAPAAADSASQTTRVSASTSSAGAAVETSSRIIAVDAENAPGRLQGAALVAAPVAGSSPRPVHGDPRKQLLADLQTRPSVLEALRDAAASNEPLAQSFIGEIVTFCTLYTSPEAQAMLADERFQPVRLRASKAPFKTPLFPTAEDEARFRDNQRAIRQFCDGFDAKAGAAAEAAAIEKLDALGSPYRALGKLFQGQVNFTGLTKAQFEAIEKALEGADIGTLALLGFQAQPLLNNYVHAANAQLDGARTFGQNTGLIAWQLALCQMGAYCGGDSLWARDACFRYGACGADFASGLRHALARDGIDPAALDKLAAQWAGAIQSKDPTGLNFRKAP
ncbi:MAG: hypothetical protein ACK4XK_12315 [Casimicrobiaceae bacterium]